MMVESGKRAIVGGLGRGSAKVGMKLIISLWFCWWLLPTAVHCRRTHPNEVSALRAIKKNLKDPNGHLERWNRGDPCTSSWIGVFCYNTTLDDGYLHVRELAFLNKNLSGSLSPQVGRLSKLLILDIMWNNISGTIPKEIGNIATLELLLLSGNQLTGSLPDELGNLSNLDRIQIDQNQISGPIPRSFANLLNGKHFHMNNCSLSGQIPAELSRLPFLVHLLLDNNNLSGPLPPELSQMPSLQILQLDNNNLSGFSIPSSYGNMPSLLKLSMRNCSLQGPIPDWSNSPQLAYIDLSLNHLNGTIPTGALPEIVTTIDLSTNNLLGTIPASFTRLPILQKLSVANNSMNGSIPSSIWQNRTSNSTSRLILDFAYNNFSAISRTFLIDIPANVSIGLQGNPVCSSSSSNVVGFCGPQTEDFGSVNATSVNDCPPQACPPPYEYAPPSPTVSCFCAAPVFLGYRLKSPGFSDFLPYVDPFKEYLSSGLEMNTSQLDFHSVAWQKGPRLRMYLKMFPAYVNDSVRMFSRSEVLRIREMFGGWRIRESHVFGPYEFLNFTLLDPYIDATTHSSSGLSKGALAGTILGTIAGSVTISALVSLVILRRHMRNHQASSKRRTSTRMSMKIDDVKGFTYGEMAAATNDFDCSTVVGQGGYGKVYRGILADGTVVAIKRALQGSLQGEKEFLTEIQLLSRLHHRNLVSLVGYCDEDGEQMLIYEFMSNSTLRDHLSRKSEMSLTFATRVKIALCVAKGILYLHTEANPPIFHRDIKASNILLDSTFNAKLSDFGLSRLAPLSILDGDDIPSHISTVVRGTPGYLDPEYFLTHKLTDKSDVYSLGVVFLEMLTGMHPISHGKNIVREVNTAHRSGSIFTVIDDRMRSYPSDDCLEKFMNLALKCCQDETASRPSMAQVVKELEAIWHMLPQSDINFTDSSSLLAESETPLSSTNPNCVSVDVSGSMLVSGTSMPTLAPR